MSILVQNRKVCEKFKFCVKIDNPEAPKFVILVKYRNFDKKRCQKLEVKKCKTNSPLSKIEKYTKTEIEYLPKPIKYEHRGIWVKKYIE
mgnify:CR=1 FL=1